MKDKDTNELTVTEFAEVLSSMDATAKKNLIFDIDNMISLSEEKEFRSAFRGLPQSDE